MQTGLIIPTLLLLSFPSITSAMENAYQWTDEQGQIHFGDRPPARAESRSIILQHKSGRAYNQPGLRPGERRRLDQIKERQQQQQHHKRASRTRIDRQRNAARSRCDEHRAMLGKSRGRDAFKKHSRYLRNNCW